MNNIKTVIYLLFIMTILTSCKAEPDYSIPKENILHGLDGYIFNEIKGKEQIRLEAVDIFMIHHNEYRAKIIIGKDSDGNILTNDLKIYTGIESHDYYFKATEPIIIYTNDKTPYIIINKPQKEEYIYGNSYYSDVQIYVPVGLLKGAEGENGKFESDLNIKIN